VPTIGKMKIYINDFEERREEIAPDCREGHKGSDFFLE